ncbi:hypothetical protein AABB87_00150 [Roseateles sp. PN1]
MTHCTAFSFVGRVTSAGRAGLIKNKLSSFKTTASKRLCTGAQSVPSGQQALSTASPLDQLKHQEDPVFQAFVGRYKVQAFNQDETKLTVAQTPIQVPVSGFGFS